MLLLNMNIYLDSLLGSVHTELLSIALALAMQKMTLSSMEKFCIANTNNIANPQCERALISYVSSRNVSIHTFVVFFIIGVER